MLDVDVLTRRALRVLVDSDEPLTPEQVAERLDVHPSLLRAIPELRPFWRGEGLERYLDWTVRDWLQYHYLFLHQGYRYGYPHLQQTWRGHPIIKNPLDCWVYQEILFRTKPDVLVELGVSFGGSGVFFADVMELMGHGEVIGVDVDLSRSAGVRHPRISRIEGSSIAPEIVSQVHERCAGRRVMVFADSNHARDHVLAELRAYAGLVGEGLYFIVEDGLADVLDVMPVPIEGPLPAVREFLATDARFRLDLNVAERYIMTQSPYGFLLRVGEEEAP